MRGSHVQAKAAPFNGLASWIAPKSATGGDEAVIYIGGFGFFATARIKSRSKKERGQDIREASLAVNCKTDTELDRGTAKNRGIGFKK
jgi:hypothetical protein